MAIGEARARGGRGEPLSAVDSAWLHMDGATHPMVITAACVLDAPLDLATLAAWVGDRLLRHRRFRERVVRVGGHDAWEEDPAFGVARHVAVARLREPGGDAALADWIGDAVGRPLPLDRPPWALHLIERFGEGSVIVVRIHHALADGVALVSLLLDLDDDPCGPSPQSVGVARRAPRDARAWARLFASDARALAKDLLLPADRAGPLRAPLGPKKLVAWSSPIAAGRVRAIRRATGATSNDVLLGAVAGALRAHECEARGTCELRDLRAIVPVYLRPEHDPGLGNHFGLVFASLPVAEPDALERVREVGRRMAAIKRSAEPAVAFAVLGALGLAGERGERLGLELFSRKASVLVTSVPGPPERVRLAGRRLSSLLVWAPPAGRIGVGVTLISYAGAYRMQLETDAALHADPSRIVRAFEREMIELERLAARVPGPPAPPLGPPRPFSTRVREEAPLGELARALLPPHFLAHLLAYALGLDRRVAADDPRARDTDFLRFALPIFRRVGRLWFRWKVEGVARVPAEGPVLLVGNHNGGLVTTDTYLTLVALWERFGLERPVHMLAHDFILADPTLRRYAQRLGALRAGDASARRAFERGDLVLVYPGSDLDTFRPFRDRNRIELGGRHGFVRLALRERVPIVPVVTAGTHEQLIVLTRGDRLARALGMRRWGRTEVFPIVLALPWGLTTGFVPYLPLPAQTTLAFGEPIRWDLPPEAADDPALVERCYEQVRAAMQASLDGITRGRRTWLGQPRR